MDELVIAARLALLVLRAGAYDPAHPFVHDQTEVLPIGVLNEEETVRYLVRQPKPVHCVAVQRSDGVLSLTCSALSSRQAQSAEDLRGMVASALEEFQDQAYNRDSVLVTSQVESQIVSVKALAALFSLYSFKHPTMAVIWSPLASDMGLLAEVKLGGGVPRSASSQSE
jgi:hypothetical protein